MSGGDGRTIFWLQVLLLSSSLVCVLLEKQNPGKSRIWKVTGAYSPIPRRNYVHIYLWLHFKFKLFLQRITFSICLSLYWCQIYDRSGFIREQPYTFPDGQQHSIIHTSFIQKDLILDKAMKMSITVKKRKTFTVKESLGITDLNPAISYNT